MTIGRTEMIPILIGAPGLTATKVIGDFALSDIRKMTKL